MCGIAGFLNLDGAPAAISIAKKMALAVAHRGPDGEGVYADSGCALAHRRLSIIDLTEGGAQPMVSHSGRFVITYNGEIYNFRELRTELEACGHIFKSRSDTEVLLAAIEQWGLHALPKLNGMFAFAVWDRHNRNLILARDRYGVKPLYWTRQANTFIFGSEAKAVIAHPDYRTEVDKEALLEYFTFQNLFTDRTLFKGIRLMPPGVVMTVSFHQKTIQNERYWDFRFADGADGNGDHNRSESDFIEELDSRFRTAVKRQLVSDVDVGAYLSGGIDSGAITALSASEIPYIKSFTTGFDLRSASGVELAYDEREKAEHLSYLFKTEHYEMVLKAGDMERIMPRLAWHIEEPRVGQSYPNFYIAQLAGKFVKVVLSGTGGDELFGGYPWRYYRAVVNDDFEHYIDKYYSFWHRLIPNKLIQEVFRPIWSDVRHVWTRDIFRDVFLQHDGSFLRPEDYVNHSLYFEAKTFLHGLLVIEDKLSMAHGLEARVPFLDNDLVDFAMKVPVRFKLGNLGEVVRVNENAAGDKAEQFYQNTRDGKLIMRNTFKRYVPDDIAIRPKQGFSAPDASWFRGESIEYIKRIVFDHASPMYDYLDREAVQNLVQEHLSGMRNRRLFIWSVMSFNHWCKAYLGGAA